MSKHTVMISILPPSVSKQPVTQRPQQGSGSPATGAQAPHTSAAISPDATHRCEGGRGPEGARAGVQGQPVSSPLPEGQMRLPGVCGALGEAQIRAGLGMCTPPICGFLKHLRIGGGGDEEAWGTCDSQEVTADAHPDSSGVARLPGGWPCVLGAYLGRGSGEEPAGRWRGEACCLRARRGWGCSGHFHCLQTEERRRQTEAGGESRGEHFKRESFRSPCLPCLVGPLRPLPRGGSVTPAPPTPLDEAPRLINPTLRNRLPWPQGGGQGPACLEVPRMAGRAIDGAPLSLGAGWGMARRLPESRKSQIHQD